MSMLLVEELAAVAANKTYRCLHSMCLSNLHVSGLQMMGKSASLLLLERLASSRFEGKPALFPIVSFLVVACLRPFARYMLNIVPDYMFPIRE